MKTTSLPFSLLAALAAGWLGLAPWVAGAQEGDEPEPPAPREETGSREVEVSEDNYRRFMELGDQRIQRRSLPPIAYSRPSGLEKMQRLPEESQKHLRDQLRGVIMQVGVWTREDAGTRYPYVPSPAAEKDASLRGEEAAAWEELVENYHEREAAIHANAARSRAASDGDGTQDGRGAAGGQGEEPAETSSGAAAGAISAEELKARSAQPTSADGDARERTVGVSQNALQYLTGKDPAAAEDRTAADASQADTGEVIFLSPGTLSIEDLENARGVTAEGQDDPGGEQAGAADG